MPRVVTYGRQPTSPPPGTYREVIFPELALLDTGTNEGWISRILSSDGADTRDLPRTIYYQEINGLGHMDAPAAAALHEVTVDGETGKLSGKGWVADDDIGHRMAAGVISGKLRHNSIDLAEVTEVEYEEHGDWWDDDFTVDIIFKQWKLGATTLVGMPAFADARAEIGSELAAAAADTSPLIVECPWIAESHSAAEIVASMQTRPSWDYFNRAEPDIPHPVIVDEPDEHGWIPVYGHLAQWRKQTRDAAGRLRHPPRARDNYANYTKPGVLTDKGFVNTGPVTLIGGHVTLQQAVEDVANTWADVAVTDGKHGPWICGVVRPHVAADLAKTYAARAGQISGYWPDGQTLRLICSVNAPGFPITAHESDDAIAAAFDTDDSAPVRPGNLLVGLPSGFKSFRELSDDDKREFKSILQQALSTPGLTAGSTAEQMLTGEPELTVDEAFIRRIFEQRSPDQYEDPILLRGPAAALEAIRPIVAKVKAEFVAADEPALDGDEEIALRLRELELEDELA